MNLEKIKKAKTKYVGKEIEYFQEISSTHIYAKKIAMSEKNNGKIIVAESQTNGIGTHGRKWYTGESKNIAMTIILKPQCKITQLNGLTIKIAKCMQKTIKNLYNITLELKEPNDLILNGKKICGFLTEINSASEKINYLLISFGFNVNEEKFPKGTEDIATSLKKELKRNFNREDIIKTFIEILEKEIEL